VTFWRWFWLINAVSPLIFVLVWRVIVKRRHARWVRSTREYRRAKFGGFISVPNSIETRAVDRPTPWSGEAPPNRCAHCYGDTRGECLRAGFCIASGDRR
jgi:hypothetical protein